MAGLFDDVLPQATPPEGAKPPEKKGLFDDVLHPGPAAAGGLFSDVLGKQKDPDLSQVDLKAPVGSEGFLGGMADVGRGLAHGVMVDLPQQVGQTAQNFGRELGRPDLAQWGDETVAAAKARDEAHPEFKQSIVGQREAQDWTSIRGGAYGAGSNTPLSTGPGLAGAATGAALGAFGGPAGALAGAGVGYVVGSLASLPLFYGGQGQQSYEEIKKRLTAEGGHTPEEIEHAATVGGRLSGTTEAGGELLEDALPFHQLFHPLAKPVKGMLVKSLFSGGLRKAAATIGAQELGEVSTETAQQYIEDEIEGRYGGGKGGSFGEAAKVIMPTALMTLLPGGLTAVHNFHSTRQLKNSLTDPALSDERRTAAAKVVFHQIADQDPETAQAFSDYAAVQIAAKQPVALGSDEFYKSAVDRPDYQAALTHLEDNAGDYAGAQAKLDQDNPPTYDVQEGEAEHIDAAPPPDTTPGYTVQELSPDTPLGNAATIAHATGAAQNAAAARQTEVDEATHAAAGETAAADDSEPPAPPPANPITGALFPFATAEAAQKRAALLTEQTGEEHEAIPHPTIHDKFAAVPKAIEAAPAPGDNEADSQGQAGDKPAETQGEGNDVQLPATDGTEEAPSTQRPGEKVEGNPPDESGPQGPGEGPGGAAEGGEKAGPLSDDDLESLFNEASAEVKSEAENAGKKEPEAEAPPTTGPGATTPEKVQTPPEQALSGEEPSIEKPPAEPSIEKVQPEAAVLQPTPPITGGPKQPYSEHHVLTWPVGTRISLGDPGYPGHKRPATIVGHDERGNPQIRIDKTGKTRPLSGDDTVWRLRPEDEPTTTGPGNAAKTDETGITPGQGPLHPGTGEPATPEQILGESAKLQHATIAGLPLTIENAAGSTRTDLKHKPPQWSRTMTEHYGRIKGTVGADGDHIDAFVRPGTTAEHAGPVYVIDQVGAAGKFDEHKVMLGYSSQAEAEAAYRANYPEGQVVGPVTQTTVAALKDWIKNADTRKPFAPQAALPRFPDLKLLSPEHRAEHGYAWLKANLDSAPAFMQRAIEAALKRMALPGTVSMGSDVKSGLGSSGQLAILAARIARGKEAHDGMTATVSKDGHTRTLTTPWGTFELDRKKTHAPWMQTYSLPEREKAKEPTYPVRVVEAESGREAMVQMPASQALKHYDDQLDKARGFLECLQS